MGRFFPNQRSGRHHQCSRHPNLRSGQNQATATCRARCGPPKDCFNPPQNHYEAPDSEPMPSALMGGGYSMPIGVYSGSIFGRRHHLCLFPSTGKPTRGVPRRIKRLDASSADGIRASLNKMCTDAGKPDHMICGDDMGLKFCHAAHINEPSTDDSPGSSRMFLLTPHALQEIARVSTRKKHDLRRLLHFDTSKLLLGSQVPVPSSAAVECKTAYDLLDVSLKTSSLYCQAEFRSRQLTRRYHDKLADQFERFAWSTTTRTKPLLFALGDGCGMSTKGVKKHTADFSTSSFRELEKRMRNKRLPVLFVHVDESFSSQVCPNSGLQMYKYSDGSGECNRLHQCPSCRTTWHRDAAVAANISFIAAHLLKFHEHPWKRGQFANTDAAEVIG